MKQRILLIALLIVSLLGGYTTQAQVVINEVCAANGSVVADFENDFEDWVEIYNAGTTVVNLEGYALETIGEKHRKWTFPNISVRPDSCLLVFSSGKDRKAVIDHYEIPSWLFDSWRYKVGTQEPDTNWLLPSFNDQSWLIGIGPHGFNDPILNTILVPDSIPSFYMRDTFTIANAQHLDNILQGFLLMEYDDAFVAYLNGIEVARNNVWTPGRPPFNALASEEHEVNYTGCNNQIFDCAEFYFVDEEVMAEALQIGTNVFAIQVHNFDLGNGTGLEDMSIVPALLLGVQGIDTTWINFPNSDNLHTSFSLESEGQRIMLKDPDDEIVDTYVLGANHEDHSWGRYPDGDDNWCLMEIPTPCGPNTGNCKTGYGKPPVFSMAGGFYENSISVSITANGTDGDIYYTIDGNTPNQFSTLYTGPISVDTTIVLRARLFPSDTFLMPGRSISATYFINVEHTLPVISVTSDPFGLYDPTWGIFELGPNVDTTFMEFPYWGVANYYQDWGRQAHVEYFNKNGTRFLGQDCTIKVHGNFSRGWPQKSLRFFANDKHGDEWFNFQPFEEKPWLDEFKSFNVRNGGVDYNTTHFRDGLMQRGARNTNADIMDIQPCVMYINGQYNGVYGIRERQDEKYLAKNYGIDQDYINLLRFNGDVMHGTEAGYQDMVDFIVDNDMSIQTNYDSAAALLDMDNYVDYMLTETYYVNGDWINPGGGTNNIKFWKSTYPETKWRYILWDTDIGLNLVNEWVPGANYAYDYFSAILQPEYTDPHSMMLKGLLENEQFKNYLINRFADLVNTEFKPEVFGAVAQDLYDEYEPEMAQHFGKWGQNPQLIWSWITLAKAQNVVEWTAQFDTVMTFIDKRPGFARDNMETLFSLNKQVDVTLDVDPPGAGTIKISTITPDTYPWEGVYFDGVPVSMTMQPNPGFIFSYWDSEQLLTEPDSNGTITLNIDQDDKFTAHFNAIDNDVFAYPNPFSNTITLKYHLPKQAQVSLKLIDVMGRTAISFADFTTFKTEGEHVLTIDPEQFALGSGVYFLEFATPTFKKTLKLSHVQQIK